MRKPRKRDFSLKHEQLLMISDGTIIDLTIFTGIAEIWGKVIKRPPADSRKPSAFERIVNNANSDILAFIR